MFCIELHQKTPLFSRIMAVIVKNRLNIALSCEFYIRYKNLLVPLHRPDNCAVYSFENMAERKCVGAYI